MPFDRRELLKGDQAVGLRVAFDSFQQTVWTALPALIVEADLEKMTLSCQPTVQAQVTDAAGASTWVNLPILLDVPIMYPNGGGYALTFPLHANDEVLVIFASRCIDSWWQSGGVQVQAEFRMHSLSDGFAIPGPRSQPRVLVGVNPAAVELRSESGANYISIADDNNVRLVAQGNVSVDAYGASATITAANITLNGNVTINGNLGVTGNIQTTTLGSDVKSTGPNGLITLLTHRTTGIQGGNQISHEPTAAP